MATTPTPVATLPDAPNPNNRATFNTLAYPWSVALIPWTTQVNNIASVTYANALDAAASAVASLNSAVAASESEDIALGSANFKGMWSSLTGALDKPACVKHNGRFWLLLNNLANVATSQPGVSADWTSLDAGIRPTAVITTNTVGVVGVCYLLASNTLTLTAPTSYLKGDYFGFREVANATGAIVDFGATKVRGGTPGLMAIDLIRSGFDFAYEDATRGLV